MGTQQLTRRADAAARRAHGHAATTLRPLPGRVHSEPDLSATNRWCACLQLMMPGGKSVAEDSIDDMAALATDSRWFSFRPKVIMPNDG